MTASKTLRYRQIHLDFHTSEHIFGIGSKFDARDFAATLKAAHVDSVTIFAKCHHGWSYYPTKVGFPHPHLARPNLMGDMVDALNAADIESPIYISAQWDENLSRLHPEWRVFSATNSYHRALPGDPSSAKQLSAAWHTMCLAHKGVRSYIQDQALEVARNFKTPGLFFDILLNHECVCETCLQRMAKAGLDAANPLDRQRNDEAVNAEFRCETSDLLHAEFPELRIFYNAGHIAKKGKARFKDYTHLELESLPTGGWGYDHFPSSARYAAALGFEYLAHTGKFHTSWGEFGGFKHPDALDYECAQMVALGSKCLVGDQLHPDGAINHDTYRSIAPAYERIEKLEPVLRGSNQVSDIAVLSAEFMTGESTRNHPSDDGAAQMLLELKYQFDIVDTDARFEDYRLVILPDCIAVDENLAKRLNAYVAAGGKLIASWTSGQNDQGDFLLPLGVTNQKQKIGFMPSFMQARSGLDARIPESPFVCYDAAETVALSGASSLADIRGSYFNRDFRHFCSHQHTPDDSGAEAISPGVTLAEHAGYIAYPVFRMYRAVGQPIYKYLVRALITALMPDAVLTTSLSSSARATVTFQSVENRHVVHLLYGPPQVRGKSIPNDDGTFRQMEMIEDLPPHGAVSAIVRTGRSATRVYDAITGLDVTWTQVDATHVSFEIPGFRIHSAIVIEG